MIREMGNAELFKLCETIPKVQCSECLLYWNQGIVYCTCGHLLKESESSQNFHQWRLDAFSIQNYVIKKGRPRGEEHFVAGGDVSKRNLKEFTIASNETQHIVIRNSNLAGLRRSASRWTN